MRDYRQDIDFPNLQAQAGLKNVVFLVNDHSTIGGIPSRVRRTVNAARGRDITYFCVSANNSNSLNIDGFYSIAEMGDSLRELISSWSKKDTVFIAANSILRDFPREFSKVIMEFPLIHMFSGQMAFFIQDSASLTDKQFFDGYRASSIICLSEADIAFQKQLGIHHQTKGFLPVAVRQANDFDPARNRHLGYVGRIDFHAKDCEKLIAVGHCAKARKLLPIKIFTTAGKNSPGYSRFVELIESNGLTEQFDIVLECTDHDVIYGEIATLLLPSKKESFGNVILEAYSYGIPVIGASYAPGPSELIKEGETGYLLDDYTGERVVDLFESFTEDSLRKLSANAFDRHKNYSFQRHLDFIENVARQAIDRFSEGNTLRVFPELAMVNILDRRKRELDILKRKVNAEKKAAPAPAQKTTGVPQRPSNPSSHSTAEINHLHKLARSGFGDYAEAKLQSILKSSTTKDLKQRAAWALARRYASIGDVEKAYSLLLTAKKLSPRRAGEISFVVYEIDLLRRLGRVSAAESVAMDAIRSHGDDARLCYSIASLPFNAETRLQWMNRPLLAHGFAPLQLRDQAEPLTIRNLTAAAGRIEGGPKVSVVMPAYNSASTIVPSARGILEQSWQNLELVIVDDCSSDETWAIVQDLAYSDNRVVPIRQPSNGGAYRARNTGLAAATGEFVTINDADDWSHPERIAVQVSHYLNNGSEINVVYGSRATDELVGTIKPLYDGFITINLSSLLMPRELVSRLGGWDEVRFAADSELNFRIRQALNTHEAAIFEHVPLSIILSRDESLTNSGSTGLVSLHYGARREYKEASAYWRKHASDLRVDSGSRPFPVPRIATESAADPTEYSVAILADFSIDSPPLQKLIADTSRMTSLALFHLPRIENLGRDVSGGVRALIHDKKLPMIVSGESAECDLLVVADPKAILVLPDSPAQISAKTSVIMGRTLDGDDLMKAKSNASRFSQEVSVMTPFDGAPDSLTQVDEPLAKVVQSFGHRTRAEIFEDAGELEPLPFPVRRAHVEALPAIKQLAQEIEELEARRARRKRGT